MPDSTVKSAAFLAKKAQLIHVLQDGIEKGIYQCGSSIPSERRLEIMLNLSRPTIHQCLLELENENILESRSWKRFITARGYQFLKRKADAPVRNVVILCVSNNYRNPTYLEFFEILIRHLPENIHCEMRFCLDKNEISALPLPEDAVVLVLGEWLPYPLHIKLGYNVIFINDQRQDANYIVPDNYNGGRKIAEHLWKLGHRRIAVTFLSGGGECMREFVERHQGIVDAYAAHHETVATLGAKRNLRIPEACKEMFRIFMLHRDFTALITLRDVLAIEIMGLARVEGLSIPEDFSLARFDDNSYASFLSPSLTSVRFPTQEIALLAVQAILEAFERPPHDCFIQKKVLPLLLERGSTAPNAG